MLWSRNSRWWTSVVQPVGRLESEGWKQRSPWITAPLIHRVRRGLCDCFMGRLIERWVHGRRLDPEYEIAHQLGNSTEVVNEVYRHMLDAAPRPERERRSINDYIRQARGTLPAQARELMTA